jgi:hypothetical protein
MKRFHSKNLLEALIECKRLMDEYLFYGGNFQMEYSNWVNLRIFLLEKDIIRSRHTTYVWVREDPNDELVAEYVKFIKKIPNVKQFKITKETSPNIIYENNLALQKEIQKLKLENRDMFKDLKEHYQGRVIAEKAYTELSKKIKDTFYRPEKDSEIYKVYRRAVEDGFIKIFNK